MKKKQFTFFATLITLALFITILIALKLQIKTPDNLPKKDNTSQVIAEESETVTTLEETTSTLTESEESTSDKNTETSTSSEEESVTNTQKESTSQTDSVQHTTAIPQIEPAATTTVPINNEQTTQNQTTKVSSDKNFDNNSKNKTYNQNLYQTAKQFYKQNYASYEAVLKEVNTLRAEVGAKPLILDDTLCINAAMRAFEIAHYQFSHTRPNGEDYYSVLHSTNTVYHSVGENIAAGHTDAKSVVEAWKASPEHYKNMINTAFTKLGIGVIYDDNLPYGYYWVQLFKN